MLQILRGTTAQLEEAVWGHKIGSFKLYMAYRNRGRLVDEGQIYAIMREAARLGAVVGVHAENEPLIDYLLENLVRKAKQVFHICFQPAGSG